MYATTFIPFLLSLGAAFDFITPNSGTQWDFSTPKTITWTPGSSDTPFVSLILTDGASFQITLGDNVKDAAGSYTTTSNPSVAPGTSYMIKVLKGDGSGATLATSSSFSVAAGADVNGASSGTSSSSAPSPSLSISTASSSTLSSISVSSITDSATVSSSTEDSTATVLTSTDASTTTGSASSTPSATITTAPSQSSSSTAASSSAAITPATVSGNGAGKIAGSMLAVVAAGGAIAALV